MPHSSASSIPSAWKNSSTSIGVGAAPTLTATAWSRPSISRSFENICSSAAATVASSSSGTGSPRWRSRTRSIDAASAAWIGARCSSGCEACIASSPAFSFSQIRGTAKNQVGSNLRQVGQDLARVRAAGDRAGVDDRDVVVGHPLGDVRRRKPRDHARAGPNGMISSIAWAETMMLWCESWTPFGGPVVPEV